MVRKMLMKMGAFVSCAALVAGSGSLAWADSAKDCAKRVRHAEKNLRDAERKHGVHSRQAEIRRREVENARTKCRM